MNKKELKQVHQMSMLKFLRDYVGISNSKLLNKLKNKPHKIVKEILKMYNIHIRSIPYEEVSLEDINDGKIILVNTNNQVAPYINPLMINYEEIMNECFYLEDYKEFTEKKKIRKKR